MISHSEFCALKPGDFLLWDYRIVRKVLSSTAYYVSFRKLRKSHIENETTTYHYNDVRNKITILKVQVSKGEQ